MISPWFSRLLPVLAAALLLGCGPDQAPAQAQQEEQAGPAVAEPAADAVADVSLQAEEASAEPREYYYDLTAFPWYREGRPLLADGAAYQPLGRPEPTASRRFEPAGEYEGVAYYVPAEEAPPGIVFIPVSPGYWQPFATTQRVAAPNG